MGTNSITHGIFIVPPQWETRWPAPWSEIPLRQVLTLRQPVLPYPNNAKYLTRKRQIYVLKSLVGCDQGSNLSGPNPMTSQNRRRTLYSLGHVVWANWSGSLCIAPWMYTLICCVVYAHPLHNVNIPLQIVRLLQCMCSLICRLYVV